MATTKRCPKCREVKPTSAFGTNRSLGDGLSFYCLECNRDRSNRWYRERRRRQGKEVKDLSWVPAGFRWCPTCQQAVAHEDYVRSSRTASGFGSECKPCHRRAGNEAYWIRQYGIPREAVEEIRVKQGDRCPLCGAPHPEHLDHDHATGTIRALLCQRCNNGLGLFKDDPRVLRAAAEYVEEHRRRQRAKRSRPLSVKRQEVVGRPPTAPVGSRPRTCIVPRGRMCSRGRAILAAREADE